MSKKWREWLIAGLTLLLPVASLLPNLGGFIYQTGAAFNDVVISHYPYALWLQRSLQEGQGIMLWAPGILSGLPATANPLSGLHYPPGWLALLFPLPLGLNLLAVLHILLAGWGMLLFLLGEGLDRRAALFGALAFEAAPKLFAHFSAGHLTLVYAVAWTPWLLLAQRAANRDPKRLWVLPGLVLGLIFLADPRYAPLAGLFWLAYTVYSQWIVMKAGGITKVLRVAIGGLGGLIVAAGVGAILWLPLLEFLPLSTRRWMTVTDSLSLSLPPARLIGLLTPGVTGGQEWEIYPGAFVLVLALIGLALPGMQKQATGWFWAAVFAVSLLWSMGGYFPPAAWLARLPGFDLIRVPPRVMFVGLFSLAVLASQALDSLLNHPEGLRRMPRGYPLPVLAGLILLVLVFTIAARMYGEAFPWQLPWGLAVLVAAFVLILLLRARRIAAGVFTAAALAILVIDLVGSDRVQMSFRPADDVLWEDRAAAEVILEAGEGLYRVYSPSYSIPQQTAAAMGLALVDGVDPLQLNAYSQFMERASGVPGQGYSVTLPPFANGDTAADNQAYTPDAKLLGLLNVGFVAAEFPLQNDDLELLGEYDGTYIYRNLEQMPRAWVQPAGAPLGEDWQPVGGIQISNGRVEVQASGPGQLVLSEISYPGWDVFIDDIPADIFAANGLLRAVDLPEGQHSVRFVFRPGMFYLGAFVSSLALLLAGGYLMITRRKQA